MKKKQNPRISIVIPAYNEEKRIGNTLKKYCEFFKDKIDFEIVVVINNTTDGTEEIVKKYSEKYEEVRYLNLSQKGKGNAVKQGFMDALKRENDLIGFVDADLATRPKAFYDLIKNIGDYDGIIGSRRMKGAKTKKGFKRKILSWGFNLVVRILFPLPFSDTQAGVKVFKREAIESIVDNLKEKGWIFDIEILYKLQKGKFKIREYPTVWEDKQGTKINVFSTSLEMLLDLIKLRVRIKNAIQR